MSFFEVGGYNVGGMNVGGVITAEQRQRMSAGKARKKEAMIQLARQYPEASLAQLEAAYRENYHQTVPRLILTPQQKLANLERRLTDPNYQPVRRERKRPMSQYQANKEILKGKLFGHPQSAKRGATPNFRQKMSENDSDYKNKFESQCVTRQHSIRSSTSDPTFYEELGNCWGIVGRLNGSKMFLIYV